MNKKDKFKYENIKPNNKNDFESGYKNTMRLIAHLKSELQQLAASYKASTDKCSDSN